MIKKNVLSALFIVTCLAVNAQVKVLDPDNMQPVQASTVHEQSLANILPMGNWATNKQLDSLKVGDTLVMTNANAIAEYELNFKREGKVTWYKQHTNVERDKQGNNTFSVENTWDVIGDWSFDNEQLVVFIDMKHNAPQADHQNCKKFVFTRVSSSYTKVKLVASDIGLIKQNK